jgi:hypothetical protein
LWAAFAIVAVAYVGRSAMRGFDFRLDLPIDAVVLALFLLVVVLVAMIRASEDAPDDDEGIDSPDETHRESTSL